jgi:nucleoside-diphosphate-sugar epimerase
LPSTPGPHVTEEFAALHQCSVQLPWTKAASILGYQPSVSFAEGMERSLSWLAFAGYPFRQ